MKENRNTNDGYVTTIVGFADDIAIVSIAKTVREIDEKTNASIQNVEA